MRIVISIVVILSLSSIGYAGWLHNHFITKIKYETDEALKRREAVLIAKYLPRFKEMNESMNLTPYGKDPETIEELFAPIGEMMDKLASPE